MWWGQPTRRHGARHHTKLKRDGSPQYGAPVRIKLADLPLNGEEFEALRAEKVARTPSGVSRAARLSASEA